jgi:hypothetical protein
MAFNQIIWMKSRNSNQDKGKNPAEESEKEPLKKGNWRANEERVSIIENDHGHC